MPYPSVSLDHEAQTAADMRTNSLFICIKGTLLIFIQWLARTQRIPNKNDLFY